MYNFKIAKFCYLVFKSPPVSKNASLNSTVEFQCICQYCEGQTWAINNKSANSLTNLNKGVDTDGPYLISNGVSKLYNMSIPASLYFNNTNITCIIFNGTKYIESEAVYLLIQGKV